MASLEPSHIPTLEASVDAQVRDKTYDFGNNHTLLKLYQFFPEHARDDVTINILIKAVMALPDTDFLSCLHLLPAPGPSSPVATLVELETHLQTFDLEPFWAATRVTSTKELLSCVPGFRDAVQSYIVLALSRTFSKVDASIVLRALDESDLAPMAAKFGFTVDGDAVVFAPNPENQAKPQVFSKPIDMGDLAGVMAACAP